MKKEELHKSVTISPDLACFNGHFPGEPILPGIVQLKLVSDLVTLSEKKKICMSGVSRVKFRSLVRPSDRLDIRAVCEEEGSLYRFTITRETETVCSGKIYFAQCESTEE